MGKKKLHVKPFFPRCRLSVYNAQRTLHFAIFGLTVHGPACHCFYSLLDRCAPALPVLAFFVLRIPYLTHICVGSFSRITQLRPAPS